MSATNDEKSDVQDRMLGSVPGAPAVLNRSHIVHGKQALILPCLARTAKDCQADGEQGVRDGSTRSVYGYRAVRHEIPPGCAAGYMPELNVPCGIADYSSQSGQPVATHLTVEIIPSPPREK